MNRENNLPQNEGGEGTVVIANTPVQKKQTAGEWLEKVAQKWKNHPGSAAAALLVWLAGFLTLAVMVFLVGFIVIRGVRYITPDLFALEYNSENVSLMPR